MKKTFLLAIVLLITVTSINKLNAQNEHIESFKIFKNFYYKWGDLKNDLNSEKGLTDNSIKNYYKRLNYLAGDLSDLREAFEIATKKCNKALEQLRNCNGNTEAVESLINRYNYIKEKLRRLDSKRDKTHDAVHSANARFRAGAKAGVSSGYWKVAGPEAWKYLIRADDYSESLLKYFSSFINKKKYRLNIDNSLKKLPEFCNKVETPIETVFEKNYRFAKSGDEKAQYNLGILYYNGQKVEKNLKSSFYWMKRSAEQEKTRAQYFVGLKYLMGEGVDKDRNKAILWTKKAAIKGDKDAQYLIGHIYFYGALEKNFSDYDWGKAEHWLKKAKAQGVTKAQKLLNEIIEMKKKY
jgi:TPR repeat protein